MGKLLMIVVWRVLSTHLHMERREPHDASPENATPRRRPALLPLAIFAACLCYFGWRFWESGEHIYGLLALINAVGLLTILFHRRH